MNVRQAKEGIAIADLVRSEGHQPTKRVGNEWWFKSTLRPDEGTASLQVNIERNIFNDFGSSDKHSQGTVIDYAMYRYGIDNVSDALKKLSEIAGEEKITKSPRPITPGKANQDQPAKIEITNVTPLTSKKLLAYVVEERGIPEGTATNNFKQVHYRIGGKDQYAAGFENDSGGWELRNAFSKLSTSKDIRVIEGDNTTVTLWEGPMDYATGLAISGESRFEHTAIILNGTSMAPKAIEKLREMKPKQIEVYRDNDSAGAELLDQITKALPEVKVIDMAQTYQGYNDINDWHVKGGNALMKQRAAMTLPSRQQRSVSGPSL